MRVKSVISRMGKKISLAMLAIVCGAAIGAGAWSLKSAQSAVSVSAEEGANTKFNATDLLSGEATIATNETLGVSGVTFNGYSDTWSKEFNGIFNGDTEIEYAFPAKVTGLWNNVDLFDFVAKKTDGTELFTVRKGITWTDNADDWRNAIQLYVGGIAYSKKCEQAAPYDSGNKVGKLYIESIAEGTAVYYTNSTGTKTLLGKFDGASTYGTGDNAVTLPKIELPEAGYKIELKDAMKKAGVTTINTAPLITKINGISVVDGVVNTQTVAKQLGLSNASEATYTANSQAGEFDYSGTQFSVANGVATTLAPTYTDDTFEMKYSIPYSLGAEGAGIMLRVDDSEGNEIVTLKKYVSEGIGSDSNGAVGGSHSYTHKFTVNRQEEQKFVQSGQYAYLPWCGQKAMLGTLKFEFKDNSLVISGDKVGAWGGATWTTYSDVSTICTITDVAKPANGYKISFAGLNGAATILINSINGKVCTGVVEDKAADFSVDISAAGESVNESGVAALNLKRGANPFTATVKNAKFAGITLNEYTKSVDISSLDLSADKTAEISYLGVTKEYAVNVYDYVVTLKDGEAETKQYLEATETVTFVAGAQSDKIFIGYANGSNLYGVNSAYTPTEDIIFNAAYIDFAMHTGASVRKQTDENNQYGMRFLAGIAETDLEKYGGFITETGVLILPEDLRAGKEITLDNFSAENKEILKIANEGNEFAKGVNVTNFEGYGVYTGVITSILPANINRKFSARGYAVIKYSDNTTAIIYTAFGVENNSRSAYEVAKAAKEAGETGAALDYYISAVDGNN